MADNYLITGYWGEPHVTAENDRGINAAMFGVGRFVLPVGEQFKAEYIGNNTIRMYDGKLMDNGAAAGIPVGEYVDLLIANAGQGMKRNDLIVFQYKQDASTLIESGTFVVIQGTESNGTASDPALTQEDLLSGEATFDQMALWRVPVSGTTISAPVKLFSVYQNNVSHAENTDNPHRTSGANLSGVVPITKGGTSASSAERARMALHLPFTTNLYATSNYVGFTITGDSKQDNKKLLVSVKVGSQAGHMCEIMFVINATTGAPMGTNFTRWGNMKVTSFLYSTDGNVTTYDIKFDKSGMYCFGSLSFCNFWATGSGHGSEQVFDMDASQRTHNLTEGTSLTEATLV